MMITRIFSAMSVRIFLIIISGVLLTAAVVGMLGERDHQASESSMRTQFAYERIENIIRILEATLPEKRTDIQDVFARMGSRVTLNEQPPADLPPLPPEMASLHAQLVPEVADGIALSGDCGLRRGGRSAPPATRTADHPPPRPVGQCLAVYTHLEDHTPLLIHLHYGRRPPRGHADEHSPYAIPLLLTGLIGITWVVASVTTKPIRKLGQAALLLARNIEQAPLPENEGPVEVRNAASAFNEMQRSIVKHVQERGFILGAIAHDLQTPLTRLRLRLEKVKDTELKQKLIDDLSATQEMVKEGLDFARLCSEDIQSSRVELTALVKAVCDDLEEAGHTVTQDVPDRPLYLQGSSHLLRRCLCNVLNNAITYAQQPVLSIRQQGQHIVCTVSDHGPGIPEAELDTVLEPFRRVEDSRSRHTGGTGLGLAIARMIVEKHAGQLSLHNKPAPETGLVVVVQLPAQVAT